MDALGSAGIKANILFSGKDPIMEYAASELRKFLGEQVEFCVVTDNMASVNYDIAFHLLINEGMDETAFSIHCKETGGCHEVILSAASSAGVLHAAYTLLEETGIVFDVTGPIMPSKLELEKILTINREIRTFLKHRGIRQHINFPMDISAYSLPDAKEYLRNLARMRLNHISFHSYPGQWYESRLSGKTIYAGGFFYDRTHELPPNGIVKDAIKSNRKYFCIPEIEPVFENREERSGKSIEWLGELISFAKQLGFSVQFSLELRDEKLEDCIAICESVVKSYPRIDSLELITQECGAWLTDGSVTGDEIRNLIAELYGKEILDDERISSNITDGMWQLPTTLKELANHLEVVRTLLKQWNMGNYPDLMLGIYTTDPPSLAILLELLQKLAPEEVGYTFLPGHGSVAAIESINSMAFTVEDMKKTMLYSWIEFDGSMFLQQNSVTGIEKLFRFYTELPRGENYYGISMNHWRTAENRTAFRYFSIASLFGPVDQEGFYRTYGNALGITDIESYTRAMKKIDETDLLVCRATGNIGFCHEPCWSRQSGMGLVGAYKAEDFDRERGEYEEILRLLKECAVKGAIPVGENYLDFLKNRIECTIHLIDILRVLSGLKDIFGAKGTEEPAQDDRLKADDICDRAMAVAGKYMVTHAAMMPDRGCEGTLISFYYTLPVYILKLKYRYGTGKPDSVYEARTGNDQGPPPPAI